MYHNQFFASDAGVKFHCRNCGREGHRRHYCPELQDNFIDRRFRCRLCGEKGHNRRTCWKSRLIESKSNVTRHHHCRVCGQSGHNRRTCPQVTDVDLGADDERIASVAFKVRAYSCRLCLKKGHNSRTCPSKIEHIVKD